MRERERAQRVFEKKPNKNGWIDNNKLLDPSIFIILLKKSNILKKNIPNAVNQKEKVFISLFLSFFPKQQF